MTLLGVAWLLAFFLVFIGLLKVALWMMDVDRAPRRPQARTTTVVETLVPDGWTVSDYAADGIRGLRIMLIQHTRDSH